MQSSSCLNWGITTHRLIITADGGDFLIHDPVTVEQHVHAVHADDAEQRQADGADDQTGVGEGVRDGENGGPDVALQDVHQRLDVQYLLNYIILII